MARMGVRGTKALTELCMEVCREEAGVRERIINVEKEGLFNIFNSSINPLLSRRMRWAGQVARMGEERSVYRVLVEKPEGKRPLGRARRRWEDNIRMDLQEV
jgi:hypothetical protein